METLIYIPRVRTEETLFKISIRNSPEEPPGLRTPAPRSWGATLGGGLALIISLCVLI